MANITSGMNVDVITGKIVPGLKREADEIERTVNDVDRLVRETAENWKGSDAKQFEQKWNGEYKNQLKKLAQELKQLSETARKNADRQRDTSASL